MTDPIRLSKRVAADLNCSRREAELLIENGAVRVDGGVVELPQIRVRPDQSVEVEQRLVQAAQSNALAPVQPVTLLLHKPPGMAWDAPVAKLLSLARRSADDASQRPALQRHLNHQRCLTPLEPAASGLIVFSQEPGIVRRLVEDAPLMEHELQVSVTGDVSADQLRQLNASPIVDRRAMLPAKVSIGRQADGTTGLRFAIKGHWMGQVAQMCDAAGLRITGIRRIRVGRVPMAGLEQGQWRYLLPQERF